MSDRRLAASELLGYTPQWLGYGMIGEMFLQEQASEFTASDDKNPEHSRYAAFQSVLAGHAALGDAAVARYVELAQLDTDIATAGSALTDLILWRGLAGEQFEWLSTHPAYDVPFLQRVIRRRRLLDRLRSGPLMDSLFEECLADGDPVVQRAMLETASIARPKVERLAEHGASRAIRNRAQARLRRGGEDI